MYFKAAFLLSVRDFEYIHKTNTDDLLTSFNNGRFNFFSMSQSVILATSKGGTDVAEGFLLAVVTRWAHSMFLMIFSDDF